MFVSFPCRCSGGVLGCYPLLLQLLLRVPQCSGIKPSACWSSPGCFQDHCSATMWNHKAACCLSVAAVAVRAFCLLAYEGLAQGLVDPRCCQEHPVTCRNCTWTCVGQCCYLTYRHSPHSQTIQSDPFVPWGHSSLEMVTSPTPFFGDFELIPHGKSPSDSSWLSCRHFGAILVGRRRSSDLEVLHDHILPKGILDEDDPQPMLFRRNFQCQRKDMLEIIGILWYMIIIYCHIDIICHIF